MIDQKLNEILEIKKEIYSSITSKGVEIESDTPFGQYAKKITQIKGETGEGSDSIYSTASVLNEIVNCQPLPVKDIETEAAEVLSRIIG